MQISETSQLNVSEKVDILMLHASAQFLFSNMPPEKIKRINSNIEIMHCESPSELSQYALITQRLYQVPGQNEVHDYVMYQFIASPEREKFSDETSPCCLIERLSFQNSNEVLEVVLSSEPQPLVLIQGLTPVSVKMLILSSATA